MLNGVWYKVRSDDIATEEICRYENVIITRITANLTKKQIFNSYVNTRSDY